MRFRRTYTPEELTEATAQLLDELRKTRGLSLRQIAAELGVSHVAVVHARQRPYPKLQRRILEHYAGYTLEERVTYLLRRIDEAGKDEGAALTPEG